MTWIQLTREELYEKVWSQPLIHLAKELGLSDRGLGKVCTRLDIPLPGRGYWRKIELGQAVTREELLPPSKECERVARFYPERSEQQVSLINDVLVQRVMQEEAKPSRQIIVPSRVHKYHPLVKKTLESILSSQWDGHIVCSAGSSCIALSCTKELASRAARLLQALVISLEKRGHTIEVQANGTFVYCHDEAIQILMREKSKQIENKPQKNSWDYRKFDYIPTGILILKIEGYFDAHFKKTWMDSPKALLEEQLNDFMIGLAKAAVAERKTRERRESLHRQWAWEREQAEFERQRLEEEKKRTEHLQQMVSAWIEAKHIKEFLSVIERSSVQSIYGDMSKNEWLTWAHAYANRFDRLLKLPD